MTPRLRGPDRGAIVWLVLVGAAYAIATFAVAAASEPRVDRAMELAVRLSQGRLDLAVEPGANDTLTVAGRTYQVLSPLPIVPHLVFVPFPGLWEASRWIVSAVVGISAAWLCLPLARAYGPGGNATWWIAAFGAFGTLLFSLAIRGNLYYLAHVEAFLFTLVALIEWRGRGRPWVVGLAIGLAALARPTLLLAAIPFAIAIGLSADRRSRALVAFLAPLGATALVAGLYNLARFGSPLETGYATSVLTYEHLARRRELGVFSFRHVPDNLALLVGRGFDLRSTFPYLVPDDDGHSIVMTSPALLAAIGAGIRSRLPASLWVAALVVVVPVLLYYGGGGFRTYGHRYFLDVVPFLLALVALAARAHFGALEKCLVVLSIAFVGYGLVWVLFR